MSEAAVLHQVSRRYRLGDETIVAVDDVTFAASAGEFICVYGASGSGKTTMLNLLAGTDVPDSGTVTVAGEVISNQSESARAHKRLHGIAMVFQSNNLLPEFTAAENVMLPLLVRGHSRSAARAAAEQALKSTGLHELADRLPSQMSGGQRQRVGISRALAGSQPLLLADEPTGALDSSNSRDLFTLMRELCTDSGTAVVVATHDPLAHEFADSVYDMVDGVITSR